MDDEEKNLRDAQLWHARKRIDEAMKAIKQNNMEAIYVEDKKAALNEVLKRIPKNAMVAHGGSYTLRETGIIESLEKGEYQFYEHSPSSPGAPTADDL